MTLRPVPADYVPVVQAEAVNPPAEIVRPGFRYWEATQEAAYADRQRLGVAVLQDVARVAERAA